jgi:hypothetical protein
MNLCVNEHSDKDGIYIGINAESGKEIKLDPWVRTQKRKNSNWLITGTPGMGKTVFSDLISIQQFTELGVRLIILDEEGEHKKIKEICGKIVPIGASKSWMINPLQIPVHIKRGSQDCHNDIEIHLKTLKTIHKLLYPSLDELDLDLLDQLLVKAYNLKDITGQTDISKLKPSDFIIYEDLFKVIANEYEMDKKNPQLEKLNDMFFILSKGAYANIFNGFTNIEFDTNALVIDLSELQSLPTNLRHAQLHIINNWVWSLIVNNKQEKVLYNIAGSLLTSCNNEPDVLEFISYMSYYSKDHNAGIIYETWSVVDLIDNSSNFEVMKYGYDICKNASYKMILGINPDTLPKTKEYFALTEQEASYIKSRQRGVGLLVVGDDKIPTKVVLKGGR